LPTNLFTLASFWNGLVTVQVGVDSASSKVVSVVITNNSLQRCTVVAGPLNNPGQRVSSTVQGGATLTQTLTNPQSNNIGPVDLGPSSNSTANLYLAATLAGA
jgi:hypothetical protein